MFTMTFITDPTDPDATMVSIRAMTQDAFDVLRDVHEKHPEQTRLVSDSRELRIVLESKQPYAEVKVIIPGAEG